MKRLYLLLVLLSIWTICDGQGFVIYGPALPQLRLGAVAWADYDGDGDPDLLTCGQDSQGNRLTVLLENSGGAFVPDLSQNLAQLSMGDVDWADMDLDGDLDLVMSGEDAQRHSITRVYRNNAGILSVLATPTLPGIAGGRSRWADFDGDGDQDLFLAGYNDLQGYIGLVARNDGGGNFAALPDSNLVLRDWPMVAIGDFDADGLPDLALGDRSPDPAIDIQTRVLHNQGAMQFAATPDFLPDMYDGGMDFRDADGDGDLDLLAMGMGYKPFTGIYSYNAGQFQASTVAIIELGQGEAKWANFNNDPYPDLIVSGYQVAGAQMLVYRGSSTGLALFQGPASMPSLLRTRLSWADWNGDGFQDFVIMGEDTQSHPHCYIGTYNPSLETFEF